MNEKNTVLVSGASGFLGKELVRQLLADTTYIVVALTSRPEKLKQHFEQASHLTVLPINEWTEKLDQAVGICVNCAFPRSSKPTELAEGLDFTERFINEVIDANIKNIINISSQSVYSQQEKNTTDETASVAPESLYGMAKYASEKLVSTLCEAAETTVNYANIRLASLTGNEFEVRMTNRFVKQALNGETITIHGGSQSIAYLEVRDAASALIAMINKAPEEWQSTYNLGNKYSATVLEIAEAVEETARQYGIEKVNVDVQPGSANFNNLIASERFYQDFDWQPVYTIPLMIEDLFKHYTTTD